MSTQFKVFSASWCMPCKAVKQKITTLPSETKELFVIFDENSPELEKYVVKSFPTIIVEVNGQLVEVITGASTITNGAKFKDLLDRYNL